ncbi:class I SAM-dependent methyltransferase [Flaviaesturariibacter flavus]|uniref:Class I SAM-dependent methyltransferase n=1 Tax=Flaviaesturariibacter flavus TaxID=2502780 RepID=A0A4R1BJP8_9BACT|nr:class I SAM-dependent methyltransferase [Flaviaesturariibacter flavus]TCJ17509.1 class I SAM-dependent methyltransferase [Flaviaesturariibacter flavus]
MHSAFQLARKYIRYYLTAMNGKGHGMHSPFVFAFILDVLNNRPRYVPPVEIEALRQALLRDNTVLTIEDLGAGSRSGATKQRSVAQLARTAVKPPKWSHFLYRLAAHYRPRTIIELGTSLGVSTAYLAKAVPEATVHTIEGSAAVRGRAQQHFAALGLDRILSHVGNFDDVLPQLLAGMETVDLAYIDGNHRREPTVRYFEQLLPHCGNDSILVFDDIHWSGEMEAAWEEIRQHPRVRCTVDLFFMGLVFFREEFKVPRHFAVRF